MTSINTEFTQLDLDRHHLHNVLNAFLRLNQLRFELGRGNLEEPQRIFLDVLPALLHFNHPMLPGYVSRSTPAGLYKFSLDEDTLLNIRKFSKSFHPNRNRNQRADILGLYSIGSFGTIAQNQSSDIDIWLCHRDGLNSKELDSLNQKGELISEWAGTLGLEVTIFLMHNSLFNKDNHLSFSQEASGSTQRFLLLDEFYRTAIYLGGQLPLWLFLQAEQEKNYKAYANTLVTRRLLPENQLIDFGAIHHIPAGEFISSAIWQLYKAIESPYKSILKLLILEIYTKQNQPSILLSSLFKKSLHAVDKQRQIDLSSTDPYLQTYYFIEAYLLNTDQHERLEFLRRCFYFKLKCPLSHSMTIKDRSKASLLLELVRQWGWDDNYLKHVDNHNHWKIDTLLKERRLVVDELNHSYHSIMEFFRQQKTPIAASNRELNILGRKLHAAFSRKSGKIDWINPIHSKNITEKHLLISKHSSKHLWLAHNKDKLKISSKATLLELLTWLHCNQIMKKSSQVTFDKDEKKDLLDKFRHNISNLITLPIKPVNHQAFEYQCHTETLAIFINYNDDETKFIDHKNWQTLDHCQIDSIQINSWNEIICHSRKGPLLDTIITLYLEALTKQGHTFNPKTIFHHFDSSTEQWLSKSLSNILEGLKQFFTVHSDGRYVLEADSGYLIAQVQDQRCTLSKSSNEQSLKSELTKLLSHYSPVGFSNYQSLNHQLGIFAKYSQANTIQVFLSARGGQADLTVIDEHGTWHECVIDYQRGVNALQPFHHFLRAVNNRRYEQPLTDIGPLDILPINFYELVDTESGWQAERLAISSKVTNYPAITLFAIVEHYDNHYHFTVHCDDFIFSELNDGPGIYTKIADYILQKRKTHQHYPCYITDIDLSPCRSIISATGELHTTHYLKMKALLEARINEHL